MIWLNRNKCNNNENGKRVTNVQKKPGTTGPNAGTLKRFLARFENEEDNQRFEGQRSNVSPQIGRLPTARNS